MVARVRAMRNWRELRDYLQSCLNLIDAAGLAAVFSVLPKHAPPAGLRPAAAVAAAAPPATAVPARQGSAAANDDSREFRRFFVKLLSSVEPRLAEFDAQGLTCVLRCMAKLDCRDREMYERLVDASAAQLAHATPHALSLLILSLATADHAPSAPWLAAFYCSLDAKLPDLSAADVANVLWGLCKLDLVPEGGLLRRIMAQALEQLPAAAPGGQDPATIIACLARFSWLRYGFRVPYDFVAQFLYVVQGGLPAYGGRELVTLLHSLVCLDYQPDDAFMAQFYGVLKERLLVTAELGALPSADFSRLLWSLSRIECAPTPLWLRHFVALSHHRLRHLRAQALSELAWALACWDGRVTGDWVSEYVRVSGLRMRTFEPHQLAVTVSALAKLNCKVPAAWLDAALAQFMRGITLGSRAAAAASASAGTTNSSSSSAAAAAAAALAADGGAGDQLLLQDVVQLLEAVPAVCEDRVWLAQQSQALALLADLAASKFDLCDSFTLARLVLALAQAGVHPGQTWLAKQTSALARCASTDDVLDRPTAQRLGRVYRSWNCEAGQQLAQQLDSFA